MKIFKLTQQLKERNALLYWTGLIHFVLLGVFVIAFFIDPREVLGINVWIKPIKFAISIWIYLWTFGWLLYYLKGKNLFVKIMSWIIALSMVTEMVAIGLQSYRGVPSHFNFETPFDGAVFGIMGLMIMANTLAILLITIMFLFKKLDLKPEFVLSIRLALIIFFIGNIVGGMMIGNGAHSIGGSDGGDGIPFFNWSTEHGDLRIAHFLGLHAIQIIPLASYFIINNNFSHTVATRKFIVWVIAALFTLILTYLYLNAINGMPLS